jgi:hypothetical protein
MKSIANTNKLTMTTMAIFIAATLITSIPAIMFTDAYAQRDMRSSGQSMAAKSGSGAGTDLVPSPFPNSPWSCASKIIKDSSEGNNLGWNPDGTITTFTINEPCYREFDSVVLVNIKDGGSNFEVCNVDYHTDIPEIPLRSFEVHCDQPPADGSELRYMVLVKWLEVIGVDQLPPLEELPQELMERQQKANATQQ